MRLPFICDGNIDFAQAEIDDTFRFMFCHVLVEKIRLQPSNYPARKGFFFA